MTKRTVKALATLASILMIWKLSLIGVMAPTSSKKTVTAELGSKTSTLPFLIGQLPQPVDATNTFVESSQKESADNLLQLPRLTHCKLVPAMTSIAHTRALPSTDVEDILMVK